ncbi:hypothetical protein BABINDRAFT_63325 [Babjeviella inositovora NRRL Y-12698]|uniref:Uncharacterized protein n=1 Tax=Babjeviella inositovora NRRL Y-12698 TaxID=984486 RepID=A0A1E3QQ61_9ASCO|nr:uncharacterized protein BABINDRAFT_63325 [Babjeviella inositovora NRRL Y-12698]ODQ79604.1 hypothetical protein BABINDRAFT_63325 [Babjeviella inositovora NRRL Y-12698]
MSFLNTIRGFGRSSKKNREKETPNLEYQNPYASESATSVRGGASPTRRSPRRAAQALQVQFQAPAFQPPPRLKSTGDKKPLFLCEPFVKTALVKGSFRTIVQLPKYVDYGEWLALNVFETYTHLNQFYGIVAEYVTPAAYPTMSAGPGCDYYWQDGSGQAVMLPAGQYIELVLLWVSNKLNDQTLFPTKNGGAFPPYFGKDVKNMCRQMFRVFAHMYHNHFEKFVHLLLEAHWNSFFAHFISFVREFGLMDKREMEPLLPLIESLEQQGKVAV